MKMYKVCPDYMSSGLMENVWDFEKLRWQFVFVDEIYLYGILSPETRELLSLCQQIFDQVDSWSSEDADYKFPHFIRREQYEILCKLVAERVESETGVPTIASFYWETDNV